MKSQTVVRAAKLAIVIAALGIFALAQPSIALAAKHRMPTATEAQIVQLGTKLHITAAQKPQWNALAAVMKENARLVHASAADRAKIHPTTVVDKLYADRKASQARLERLERVIPVAEALYAVLTPEQKAKANILFAPPRTPAY
jgi:Spy/CpxP family protein refolding chaperone